MVGSLAALDIYIYIHIILAITLLSLQPLSIWFILTIYCVIPKVGDDIFMFKILLLFVSH